MGCKGCGQCCKWLLADMASFNGDVDWLMGRGGITRGRYALLPSRCRHLGDNNKCSIHDHKPVYCQKYPNRVPLDQLVALGCQYYNIEGRT